MLQFSVCAFRAEIDGKVIEGQIKEKEKAKEQYDDAIASGHGMFLASEVSCALHDLGGAIFAHTERHTYIPF